MMLLYKKETFLVSSKALFKRKIYIIMRFSSLEYESNSPDILVLELPIYFSRWS